jgi:hypothetical protein
VSRTNIVWLCFPDNPQFSVRTDDMEFFAVIGWAEDFWRYLSIGLLPLVPVTATG